MTPVKPHRNRTLVQRQGNYSIIQHYGQDRCQRHKIPSGRAHYSHQTLVLFIQFLSPVAPVCIWAWYRLMNKESCSKTSAKPHSTSPYCGFALEAAINGRTSRWREAPAPSFPTGKAASQQRLFLFFFQVLKSALWLLCVILVPLSFSSSSLFCVEFTESKSSSILSPLSLKPYHPHQT